MTRKDKSKNDLLSYSHDSQDEFKKTSDDLFALIDQFGDQELLSELYDYYQRMYGLPEKVVKQQLKNSIALFYQYKKGQFREDLKLKHILFSMFRYVAALLYALIHSINDNRSNKYKLIVDEVAASLQLRRFSKLISIFKKENVLIVTDNKTVVQECPEYNFRLLSNFKYCDRPEVLKVIRYELLSGIWICLKVSIKSRVNLFRVSMNIIRDYLYYSSLFKSCHSDFIIQERHYKTSAVKNYLFKQMGGSVSATLQKNIIQLDSMCFFSDIDWLFSLGKRGVERIIEYGGRIDRVIPIGSMFMEYYWFQNTSNEEKIYDVVMLGINTMNAYDRLDSYTEFMDDYYDSFRWLVRFKKEYPNYCVAIKHHASAGIDEIENQIILDSNVKVLDKAENSYKISFSSHCAVTFGSTMGYELNAHKLPTFFIDPGLRCTFLPDKDHDLLGRLRVDTYEVFRDSILEIMEGPKPQSGWINNPKDLCLESSTVSNRMYDAFVENLQ
jgi:hypothetical protein